MKPTLRNVTLAAASLVAAVSFTPRSEAAVRVRVGVRVGAPLRVVAPVRVVGVRPGPRYLLVEGAWVLPPWSGAVWVPGHYDRFGVYVAPHWRR